MEFLLDRLLKGRLRVWWGYSLRKNITNVLSLFFILEWSLEYGISFGPRIMKGTDVRFLSLGMLLTFPSLLFFRDSFLELEFGLDYEK